MQKTMLLVPINTTGGSRKGWTDVSPKRPSHAIGCAIKPTADKQPASTRWSRHPEQIHNPHLRPKPLPTGRQM